MGIVYSAVILLACLLGAIVGIAGGVFIRPVFDAIGYHNVLNISFFASSAILVMAIVSTIKKVQDGTKIEIKTALLISMGAVLGGIAGNLILEYLLTLFYHEANVQRVQIVATIIVLSLSLFFTAKTNFTYKIKSKAATFIVGVQLGAVAVFLGIGGGPINVPILTIFFGLPIKLAAAYSIVIVFFSHMARLITMGITIGYGYFDLPMLAYVIPAAAAGGFIGAKFSKIFSGETVKRLFMAALCAVILLNVINGLFIV